MNIKIGAGRLHGTVQMISSKSDVHRLLLAAALADGPTEILLNGTSEDIEATMLCLKALGSRVEKTEGGLRVVPIPPFQSSVAVLDCRESGSTLRFLLPVAGALGRNALFEGRGRLPQRPIGVLTGQMERHGCRFNGEHLPLEISGHLTGGVYELPGNISSQFITGLLFALPMLEEDSEIRLTTAVESQGYIQMTLHTLSRFGIAVEATEQGYFIKGGQKYHSPGVIQAAGDWSNAAFWLTAGAVGSEVTCRGLQMDSPQGDKAILPLLERFGAQITVDGDSVTAKGGKLKGCKIDASQIPDLVPILSVAAAMAEGDTYIFNAGRLRIKESDRLRAITDCLRRLGVDVEEEEEALLIHGGAKEPSYQEIHMDSYGDHRIVMSAAVAGAVMGQPLLIEGAEAVGKSYPGFFAEFIRLGGGADVL